ncbi:MAG: YfhO family protein [Gemmatimonadetes bacterium]|nr:YfhO family protein [Gemmatimonadota bacterium]
MGFRISAGVAAAVFFGLALVYFFPALLPGRGIYGTDYLGGGYPFSEFIAGRLKSGELPKWVPYVYGGMPLFANAGSTFYPVWLLAALLVPVSLVLPLLFVVQFGLAGFGMFLLLRELDVRPWVALVAGLAFEFTGLTMSYVYAGHDGRIVVATLAPMFLFFLHRLVRTGGLGAFLGAAATLAFSLLSFQVQSNYYLLLAGLGWAVFALVSHRVRGAALWRRLGLGLGAVALAFVLNAVNFLPFMDYVDQSPRGGEGRGYEYATSWAMSPGEISALAVPELIGASLQDPNTGEALFPPYRGHNFMKLHTEYAGAFALLFLLIGAWYARKDRRWWFFVGLVVFALTISFGAHTPIYRLYYELLPGTKRFRAPSISFFLVSMSLVVMAGLAMEHLARARDLADSKRLLYDPLAAARWIALGAAVLAMILIVVGGNAGEDAPGVDVGFARFALFLAAAATVVWLWIIGRMGPRMAAIVLGLVVVSDLWVVGRRFFHTVPPPDAWFQTDDVVNALRSQPGIGRAWVLSLPGIPAYHGSGNALMLHDIEQAGGEHPNPLNRWYEYVGAGRSSYVDWHNLLDGEAAFLNAANVRWIVSMVRLEGAAEFPSVRLIHGGPSALIYENTAALPRAWLVGDVRVVAEADGALGVLRNPEFDPRLEAVVQEQPSLSLTAGPVAGEARILESSPDEVRIASRSDRAAFLVLADNYYDGWEATIDGEGVPVLRTNHTFRGVAVPAGEHEVVFRFRPGRQILGFWISLLGFLGIGGYAVWALVRRRRRGGGRAVDAAPA